MFELKYSHLTLRELTIEDEFFDVYASWLRDYDNIKMIGRYSYFLSCDKQEIYDYVQGLCKSENDTFFLVLYEGKPIGTFKIGHINWHLGQGDVGIMLGDTRYKGKNLSEEVCRVGMDYAFRILGLRRLSAGCYEDNIPMNKCFERIGFNKIGVERQNVLLEGKYANHCLWDIMKDEFYQVNQTFLNA